MLVIHPEECIDCGVCEPECPEEAILPDTDPDGERWLELNETYSLQWPNIRQRKDPPEDAADFAGVPNKFEESFDPKPATAK